jgi:purine-cytosine permease-like protein
VIILGVIAVNVLNLYGMFMCVTTTVTALRPLQVKSQIRTLFILVSAIIGTVVALAATSSFQNFILFLAYFMIPWTAINLTDFYLIRKEKYDRAYGQAPGRRRHLVDLRPDRGHRPVLLPDARRGCQASGRRTVGRRGPVRRTEIGIAESNPPNLAGYYPQSWRRPRRALPGRGVTAWAHSHN